MILARLSQYIKLVALSNIVALAMTAHHTPCVLLG
jgi:hypothetical protein